MGLRYGWQPSEIEALSIIEALEAVAAAQEKEAQDAAQRLNEFTLAVQAGMGSKQAIKAINEYVKRVERLGSSRSTVQDKQKCPTNLSTDDLMALME